MFSFHYQNIFHNIEFICSSETFYELIKYVLLENLGLNSECIGRIVPKFVKDIPLDCDYSH